MLNLVAIIYPACLAIAKCQDFAQQKCRWGMIRNDFVHRYEDHYRAQSVEASLISLNLMNQMIIFCFLFSGSFGSDPHDLMINDHFQNEPSRKNIDDATQKGHRSEHSAQVASILQNQTYNSLFENFENFPYPHDL